jgi:3-hydroxyisobutyrate dehydrogenase
MAERLSTSQHHVTAFDRNPGQCHTVEGLQVTIASSPADVVNASDIIISSVTDDKAVNSLFFGMDGLLSASQIEGKLFIEMSTIQPATIRAISPTVEQRGGGIVDVPVLGSVPAVRGGTLLALAGGGKAHIDRALPILNMLARRVVHLGPIGSGYAMKLAVNLTMAAYLQSLAEGLSIGVSHGLSIDMMLDILGEAPTANPWLASKLAVPKGGRADVTLDIRTLRKDVMCAIATGACAGIPMPAAGGILACLSAAVASGQGHGDLGELPRFFQNFMLQTEVK